MLATRSSKFGSRSRLTHQVVHLLELAHANCLEWSLDEATLVEVDGLGSVLAVADIGALDRLDADDSFEHWSTEECTGRKTDGDDSTAGTDILSTG